MQTSPIPGLAYAAVISLPKDEERRTTHLESAPFTVEVVNGVDLRTAADSELDALFDRERGHRKLGRPITAGEIGCTHAHLGAMRSFLTATDGMPGSALGLIAEDDTRYASDALARLSALVRHPHDLTYLGHDSAPHPFHGSLAQPVSDIGEGSVLQRIVPWTKGAVGYLITRDVAAHFVRMAESARPYWVADDYELFTSWGLDLKGVSRPVLEPTDHHDVSSIGSPRSDHLRAQTHPGSFRAWAKSRAWPPRFTGESALLNRTWLAFAKARSRLPLSARLSKPAQAASSLVLTTVTSAAFLHRTARRRLSRLR